MHLKGKTKEWPKRVQELGCSQLTKQDNKHAGSMPSQFLPAETILCRCSANVSIQTLITSDLKHSWWLLATSVLFCSILGTLSCYHWNRWPFWSVSPNVKARTYLSVFFIFIFIFLNTENTKILILVTVIGIVDNRTRPRDFDRQATYYVM